MPIKSLNAKKSRIIAKSAIETQLNRNSSKPEVVIVSPKSQIKHNTHNKVGDKSSYYSETLIQSDSSLSENISNQNSHQHSALKVTGISFNKSNQNTSSSKYPHHATHHDHEHDRISVSSLNTVLDDIKPRKDSQQMTTSQRRASVLRRNWVQNSDVPYVIGANITEDNHGLCGKILLGISWFLIVLFFPLSLFITIKVVQEYE